MRKLRRLASLLTVALAGIATATVGQASLPPNNGATMAVSPASGPASTSIRATITFDTTQGQCEPFNHQSMVTFSWDMQVLNTVPQSVTPNCNSALTFTPPSGFTAPGQHAVCGTTGDTWPQPNQAALGACTDFTIPAPPTPTPRHTPTPSSTSMPTPTPTPTPTPSPSPTPSPTALPTPSPSAAPPPLPPSGAPPTVEVAPSAASLLLPWGLGAGILGGLLIPGFLIARDAAGARRLIASGVIVVVLGGAVTSAVASVNAWALGPTPKLSLDSSRITQGLDYDYGDGAAVAYDMIAGKDTLVRAQLRITDLGSGTVHAICKVVPPSDDGSVADIAPSDGDAVAADITETSTMASTDPSTPLTSTYRADCWMPGYLEAPAGTLDMVMTVRVTGLHPHTYVLGTPTFQSTGDLRLLIFPQEWPVQDVSSSEAHPWTYCGDIAAADLVSECPKREPRLLRHDWDDLESITAFHVLEELDRVWPLRSGVGALDMSGSSPHTLGTPGLRYFFAPIYDSCPPFPVGSSGLRTLACDVRGDAQLLVSTMNAKLAAADAADGGHRDRLDQSTVFSATDPVSTGGQCIMGTGGNGVEIDTDPDGVATYVAAQENTHCYAGMLHSKSPHSISTNATHSKNDSILTTTDQPGVNMLTHEDVIEPHSIMPPSSGSGGDVMFMEGWDWNEFRTVLLDHARGDVDSSTYRLTAAALTHHLVVSLLVSGDTASLRWSAEDDSGLRSTAPSPAGRYSLVLRDGAGTALSTLPFDPGAQTHAGAGASPIALISDLPDGVAELDVTHGAATILRQPFRGAPGIGTVSAGVSNDGNGLDVSWQTRTPGALYSVWYAPDDHTAPIPVALDVPGTHAHLGINLVAPARGAIVSVHASDGMHTTSAAAAAVQIPDHGPTVEILKTEGSDSASDIEPVSLHALAFANSEGLMSGREVRWQRDGQDAGGGNTVRLHLSAGDHVITVRAIAHDGRSATASITVHVAHRAPPGLLPAPTAAAAHDLGECPGLGTVTVAVPSGTSHAATNAAWLALRSASGGGATLAVDCSKVPSGATLATTLTSADVSGAVHVQWLLVHGGGLHAPAALLALIAALGVAAMVAAAGVLLRRRL